MLPAIFIKTSEQILPDSKTVTEEIQHQTTQREKVANLPKDSQQKIIQEFLEIKESGETLHREMLILIEAIQREEIKATMLNSTKKS